MTAYAVMYTCPATSPNVWGLVVVWCGGGGGVGSGGVVWW